MAKHIFKEGESGNPNGRPKGAINKNTKLIKDVFTDAFNEMQSDQKTSLLEWGKKNPTEFYKLASKLIPAQMDIKATIGLANMDIDF